MDEWSTAAYYNNLADLNEQGRDKALKEISSLQESVQIFQDRAIRYRAEAKLIARREKI